VLEHVQGVAQERGGADWSALIGSTTAWMHQRGATLPRVKKRPGHLGMALRRREDAVTAHDEDAATRAKAGSPLSGPCLTGFARAAALPRRAGRSLDPRRARSAKTAPRRANLRAG
jgi:hypothetical protein